MHTLKLTLAYDGTDYSGWQVQPNRQTLQGTLEEILRKITGAPTRTTASGRTDAGVHALGQVVGFTTSSTLAPEVLQQALNAELPNDMSVLSVERAADSFHPIRDARRKRYRYVIDDGKLRPVFSRRYCWHSPCRLDAEAMHRAAQPLVGTHDFSSFESSGAERASSVRTVYELSAIRGRVAVGPQPDDVIGIEIEADGFLYNMVRAIVGTLYEVGRGARDEPWPAEVLAAADRRAAGGTAPPQGLFLMRVDYA